MHRAGCTGTGAGMAASLLAATLLSVIPLTATPALAHPHVWVIAESAVVFDKGAIIAVDQKWTFDELYTAMAVQGLDSNGDGKFDRQELAELAKVYMEGLKEFDYFTYPVQNGTPIKLAPPKDYWLDYKNNTLTLHLMTPLEAPLALNASAFSYSISDPTFFIAFSPAATDAVKVAGHAAAGCTAALKPVTADQATTNLADAFGVPAEGDGPNRPIVPAQEAHPRSAVHIPDADHAVRRSRRRSRCCISKRCSPRA